MQAMRPELAFRALGPHDAVRLQQFVRELSPRSRRERYFSEIRQLTPRQLERTLRAPGTHDMSLAAFDGDRRGTRRQSRDAAPRRELRLPRGTRRRPGPASRGTGPV